MAASTFLFLLAVCLMVQSSYQRKCYKCLGPNFQQLKTKGISVPGLGNIDIPQEICPENLSKNGVLSTCAPDDVCLKIDGDEGSGQAIRTCASAKFCESQDKSKCHTCNSDGCNGASSMSIAMFVLAVPTLIWKLC